MELRINYDRVLKEGCRKTADLTSALDVATQRSRQHRPAVEVTSLEDFPNKPDKAAGPSALGRQQAANNLNSRIANKELSLQQQHVESTEDPGSNDEAAATEENKGHKILEQHF